MTIDDMDDRKLDELLHQLDHDPPDVRAEDIIRRAAQRDTGWRRAAAILLLASAAGGIAYALPGSPLPGWIGARQPGSTDHSAPDAAAPAGMAGIAGVAVTVTDSLRVDVTGVTAEAFLIVSMVDGAELTASAPGGSAAFRSEPHRLVIELLRADTVHIGVPPAARIHIVTHDRLLFRLRDGTTDAALARAADGTWRIPIDGAPVTNR